MLMPSHAKMVQPYRDTTPIFARYGIEAQLDRMLQPQVTLKSRRLHHHQPDRGAGRDRRQLGPLHQGAFDRGHGAPDQPGGGRGSRPPAAPARPCRPDRHRLHRHGGEPQQPGGREAAQGPSEERPGAHPGRPHLAFRPAGDVAPAHPRQRARIDDEALPALRRHGPCPLGFVGCAACRARHRGIPAEGLAQPHHRQDAVGDGALRAQPQAQHARRARSSLRPDRSRSRSTRPSARSTTPSCAAQWPRSRSASRNSSSCRRFPKKTTTMFRSRPRKKKPRSPLPSSAPSPTSSRATPRAAKTAIASAVAGAGVVVAGTAITTALRMTARSATKLRERPTARRSLAMPRLPPTTSRMGR